MKSYFHFSSKNQVQLHDYDEDSCAIRTNQEASTTCMKRPSIQLRNTQATSDPPGLEKRQQLDLQQKVLKMLWCLRPFFSFQKCPQKGLHYIHSIV